MVEPSKISLNSLNTIGGQIKISGVNSVHCSKKTNFSVNREVNNNTRVFFRGTKSPSHLGRQSGLHVGVKLSICLQVEKRLQ